ncbi:LytR/AlgR family response regulator transcription factor [Chitinophaga sancti]|uniref:LytTR family DNA-binding domain-containing protein n=1 Tax=Chitinophaga sancti TaxID=1004 RepID=A0A1K1S535_9BACT|nr:LytTR family DNA-binding domain-containing protein [Chitinophaga sancti]WQD63740.1 LytTR family DNA-binding domain-containing protein [Chitinophaga sancti]WQG90635.1 LytTR family DNA-binding domain-containing protein [Chitinophaga sancti]SFW79133.1 two component transcriptional regulator, LytTR family [Chitinophaga sancti]
MKLVIIEDEKVTARDLARTILQSFPDAEVIDIISTVREGIAYFSDDTQVDLIFSDIQLGDGLSFEIFSRVEIDIPVIFCTAFDEYALDAFRANGIEYILKPFDKQAVAAAINKYLTFTGKRTSYKALEEIFINRKPSEPGAVLVYQKDKIFPVAIDTIAFFYLKNGIVYLTTFDKKTYPLNKNMEELTKLTEPLFFRANRQYLVHRKSVQDASSYLSRKLSVTLSIPVPETITISREKVAQFLEWLTQA